MQCKQKDALTGKRLSAAVLEQEALKAKAFKPKLDAFILATTAPRDAKIQEKARELSATAGFAVTVWSWDDIAEELFHRIDLLRSIFPIYWPTLDRLGCCRRSGSRRAACRRRRPELFGRERELAQLDAAWQDRRVNVFTWVAWGGAGKTSLTAKLGGESGAGLRRRRLFRLVVLQPGHPRPQHGLGRRLRGRCAALLRRRGKRRKATMGAWEKGAHLAELLARRKALLILDGLEPLQHSAQAEVKGQLEDPAIQALLRGLAARNAGLCVVTTWVPPTDLDNWLDGVRAAPQPRPALGGGRGGAPAQAGRSRIGEGPRGRRSRR